MQKKIGMLLCTWMIWTPLIMGIEEKNMRMMPIKSGMMYPGLLAEHLRFEINAYEKNKDAYAENAEEYQFTRINSSGKIANKEANIPFFDSDAWVKDTGVSPSNILGKKNSDSWVFKNHLVQNKQIVILNTYHTETVVERSKQNRRSKQQSSDITCPTISDQWDEDVPCEDKNQTWISEDQTPGFCKKLWCYFCCYCFKRKKSADISYSSDGSDISDQKKVKSKTFEKYSTIYAHKAYSQP